MNPILLAISERVIQSRIRDLPRQIDTTSLSATDLDGSLSMPELLHEEVPLWKDALQDGDHVNIQISMCARSTNSIRHVPLERWELQYEMKSSHAKSFFMDDLDEEEDEETSRTMHLALHDFIKRLPLDSLFLRSKRSCKIEYGSSAEPTENVDMEHYCFSTFETSIGRFTLSVSYLQNLSQILDTTEHFESVFLFSAQPTTQIKRPPCYCHRGSINSIDLRTSNMMIPASPIRAAPMYSFLLSPTTPPFHLSSLLMRSNESPLSTPLRSSSVIGSPPRLSISVSPPPASFSFLNSMRSSHRVPLPSFLPPSSASISTPGNPSRKIVSLSASLPIVPPSFTASKPRASGYNIPAPKSKTCRELFTRPGTPTPSRELLTRSAPLNVPKKSNAVQYSSKASSNRFAASSDSVLTKDLDSDHVGSFPDLRSSAEDELEMEFDDDDEDYGKIRLRAKSIGSDRDLRDKVPPMESRLRRGGPHPKENEDLETREITKHDPIEQPQLISALCLSPSDLIGPFAGSFQESLMSGHMCRTQSTTYDGFIADLGVSGKNYLPPHTKIKFSAVYYHIDHDTPYVGTIELDKRGYQVPERGMIQLTLVNPTKTPFKSFLVKYDISDMPQSSRTFLRQIVTSQPGQQPILRYAVHLKFICPRKTKKKYYLYKDIRIVFAHRTPDDSETLLTTYETPSDPKYFPYTPRKKSPTKDASSSKKRLSGSFTTSSLISMEV